VNLLDAVVAVLAVSAMFGGYRAGLLARAASWVGLAVGFYAATRVLPSVVEALEGSVSSTRLLVAAAVLVGGAFLGQAIGLVVGSQIRAVLPPGPLRMADRVAGGVLGGLSVLVVLWLLLPSLADVPGWPARQARNSSVARFVDSAFPRPPDTMQALRSLVGEHGFPQVFDALRPAPDVGTPPVDSGLRPDVQARVARSTVKVVGEACRRIQEGSGFAAEENVVVTNAHVVAGEQSVEVVRPDGRRLRAVVAVFDPERDLAVLRVAGLGQTPLGRDRAREGDTGAVFGHPGGQERVRAAPAKISRRVQAVGRDIYNRRPTRRDVFIMAADLAPGDSGGALVNTEGLVVGVAFAIAPDRPGTAYAVTTSELEEVLSRFAANPQARDDTQACLAR
jgi:S1-C subfamily serine protease